VTDLAWWAVDNWKVPAALVLLAVIVWGWFASPKGATFVYRITSKKGECLRVGIAQLHRDGLANRMKTYRTGQDRSQRKPSESSEWTYPWAKWVRWWIPPVPYRLARLLGRKGWTVRDGRKMYCRGWWPGMVTLELRVTRRRAEAYEAIQIVTVQPRFNKQLNPRNSRRKAAA
jgi:hypothetical protein